MADGGVPIVLSPEPFARTTTYVESPAGCTVRTMLASAVSNGHLKLDDLPRTNVYVDGARIDRDEALSLILVEGQIVNVVVEPLGGGGGGKKDVGQILLTIAVIAVSMWVGGPAGPLQAWPMLARQVAAAAILTAGQMAIAAIFKPESNVSKANDRYALSSASNQYRPWASMPMALGEVVVAPDLAVKTFTQAQGEDQWIYGILGLHYGPCTAEDLKIGDTLVSSMGAGDVRVAYHLTPGPRTFSIVANDTDQLDLQEELQATVGGSTAVVRAASAEGERFEFDFFLPQGLYFAKDDGRKIGASLTVTIRYRPIDQNGVPTGSGAWAAGLTIPLSSASSDPWRIMHSISLPLGRYEFEVKRSKLEDDNAKRKTDIGWTAIRAIAFRKPVMDETLSLIEFAVRASALNQGNLAPFTCRITPICETWTGTQWGAPVPTSNPAAITRWLMTGPAPAVALTKPQADVGLRTWAALCDQYNWKSHIYLTEDRKQDAVMQLLGMNGRASLFWDGTQLVSAPWVEKPAPRQLFAGSNLKDHRWEIVYPDPVHALRVEFQNIDQGGEADEIYVYADGYGETADPANNILPATLVEALRLEGQQTIERAYRDGRWNLGARMHQRRVDSWSTDVEHIVCRYGDRVRLAWDRVGTANATVRNRLWSGGLVSGLRLSQPVRMEPGRVYALDLRLPDQVITGVPIVNPATTAAVVTRSVMFADLRAANVTPRGGDLVAFGEPQRISEDVEIIGITPGADLTANMVGIRYVAPLLMAGETGPIPPLQSRLTRDRAMDPPMPTLLGWQANEEGVRIGFSMPPWRGSPITGFTVRWRQTPAAGQSSAWVPLPDLPANAMTAVTPPLRELPAEGTNVTSAQVQIVAVTADGRVSLPLQVTVQEAAIQQPPSGDWSVTELTEGPDGSRQSGFLVVGLVGSINPRRVTVEYGDTSDGPWDAAFDGPPVQGVVRAPIMGMRPGAQCWIAITYWTAQASAPSDRRVLGPYTAPGLIAGDLSPESPVRIAVTEITDRLVSVEQISATNAAAVADLEEVFGDTVSAAASALAAGQAANLAVLKAGEAGDAATASNISAGIASTKADEAGVSAQASNAAKVAAEIARDGSSGSAAASATNAAQALAYRDQAGEFASSSSGSANQAATSAGQSLAYRDQSASSAANANTAAISAGVSATTAREAANSSLATAPGMAVESFGVNQWATLNALANLRETIRDSGGKIYVENGALRIANVEASQHIHTAKAAVRPANHRFKVAATYRRVVDGANTSTTLFVWSWDASGNVLDTAEIYQESHSVAQGLIRREFDINLNPAAAWVRTMLRVYSPVGLTEVLSIETIDAEGQVAAAASAAAATTSAASASASAAAASISANLASQVGQRPNLLPNSDFAAGLTGWTPISGVWGSYVHAQFGPLAHSTVAGNTYLQSPFVRVDGGATYTVSLNGDPGPSGNAAIYFQYFDANQNIVSDGNAFTSLDGMSWVARRSATFTPPSNIVFVRIIFYRSTASTYPLHVARVMFAFGAEVVPWNDSATTISLQSSLSITASTAADLATRMASARFEVIAAAGSDPAQLLIRADTSGSLAALVATSIRFSNVIGGQIVEAMKLIGGEVFFMRPIYIDVGSSRLIVGPGGTWVLWFGATSQTAATATRTNGAFCLGTDGKVYYGTGLLASGVTQAKIASFSGNVGRPAPLMVAGQTEAVTVPQNGRFIVEMTNGLTSSFSDSAGGLLRLYISKDGAETQLGSLNVNAGGGDYYFDLSALNMDVTHDYAGAVKFVVKTNGNGRITDGQGTVSGTLKATYYPN